MSFLATPVSLFNQLFNQYGKPLAVPTRTFLTGDSISSTTGFGTGVANADMYASKLIAEFPNINWVQCAVPNAGINGYWHSNLMAADLIPSDVILGLHGFNDMRRIGPGAPVMSDVERSFDAFYSWCALPASVKVKSSVAGALNPLVTFLPNPAAWTAWAAFAGGNVAAYSTTNGASQTFTVTGDTVYVWYTKIGGGTGTFTISIDGTVVAEMSTVCSFSADGTGNPATYMPMVAKFRGLSRGQHTVVITLTNNQVLPVLGCAGFYAKEVVGPTVFAGTMLRMNATGYALAGANANDPAIVADGPAWMKGDGGVQTWINNQNIAVNRCRTDGLSVMAVDTSLTYEPASMVTADNIHPKATWHTGGGYDTFKSWLNALGA